MEQLKLDQERLQAARKAKKDLYAKQIFPIGKSWRVRRFDEMNWTIEQFKKGQWIPPDGHRTVFYGSLKNAFQRLPDFVINEEYNGNIYELRVLLSEIRENIDRALP